MGFIVRIAIGNKQRYFIELPEAGRSSVCKGCFDNYPFLSFRHGIAYIDDIKHIEPKLEIEEEGKKKKANKRDESGVYRIQIDKKKTHGVKPANSPEFLEFIDTCNIIYADDTQPGRGGFIAIEGNPKKEKDLYQIAHLGVNHKIPGYFVIKVSTIWLRAISYI